MRHFDFLSAADRQRLFFRAPEHFTASADPALLAVALGATLYSPASRPELAADIAARAAAGVVSLVVCLEDAVADAELAAAEQNVLAQLRAYAQTGAAGPLVFVRVRAPEQIRMIVSGLGEDARILTGFVLPKFTDDNGTAYLEAVVEASTRLGRRLLVMPVLESQEIIFAESRLGTLFGVRQLLDKYRDHVLAVRIGATDLSAAYGLRRSRDLTVYDVRMLADVIADVVNVFGRADGTGYAVTGPVWEYFSATERMFKPQLRDTPFVEHSEPRLRAAADRRRPGRPDPRGCPGSRERSDRQDGHPSDPRRRGARAVGRHARGVRRCHRHPRHVAPAAVSPRRPTGTR